MDLDVLSLDVTNENLKCTNCKNYLSYLPIYLTSGKNICGRCPVTLNKKKCSRNLAFEVLSQSVYFPCRFKNVGCEEKMLPKDIPDHEELCRYKIMKCPNSNINGCDWEGAFPSVVQHCLDKHFDNFLSENGDFTVDLTKSYQSENYLEHDEVLYIFSKKFDTTTNILQCAVYHIEGENNMTNYSCTLTLKNCKRILSDECCTTPYHEKEYISYVLDCLKIGPSIVSGKITIKKAIEDEVDVQERINKQLLSQLRCAKCSIYVLPPIYHHKDNNIYCSDCQTVYQFRNYSLDNIAYMLNYPCEYEDKGCNVVLKPEQMKKHKEICQYGNHDCPFLEFEKCLWVGIRKDMFVHIQENHKENILENGAQISESFDYYDDLTECYLIHYLNHLFRLVFSAGNWNADDEYDEEKEYFKWSLQKVGYFEGSFKYEIEIIDKNENWRRFLGRQLCSQLTDKKELFKNSSEYCHFNYDQLTDLLEDESSITFKVRIFQ